MPLLHQGCMADWEDFGQGKTRNELSHGWRIHKMLTSERIKALKTEIVQKGEKVYKVYKNTKGSRSTALAIITANNC